MSAPGPSGDGAVVVRAGQAEVEVQERYDTWFLDSPAWTRARSS